MSFRVSDCVTAFSYRSYAVGPNQVSAWTHGPFERALRTSCQLTFGAITMDHADVLVCDQATVAPSIQLIPIQEQPDHDKRLRNSLC